MANLKISPHTHGSSQGTKSALKVAPITPRQQPPRETLQGVQGATLWEALAVAAWVTQKVGSGQSLTAALLAVQGSVSSPLTAPLRGASQDLAYCAQRQKGLVHTLVGSLIKKPIDTLEPVLLALFEVALSVLATEDGVVYDEHTLVDQAVQAVPCVLAFASGKAPLVINFSAQASKNTQAVSGFVNAVLRTFLREREARLARARLQANALWNHPQWWQVALKRSYPLDWQRLLKANNLAPAMVLRVNERVLSGSEAVLFLSENGIESSVVDGLGGALKLTRPIPVGQIPKFNEGWFSVQDSSAQRCAQQMQLSAGHRVLDACAAPGGKTMHLLECEDIVLTAIDSDAIRLKRVEQNMARIAHTIPSQVLDNLKLITADATDLESWWDGQYFDRILLDAPCSGSGVVRRHPDIRWLRRESDLVQLQRQQEALLHALWQVLKPGGLMLYVTCSVFPEEGERQIVRFCSVKNQSTMTVRRLPSFGHITSATPFPGLNAQNVTKSVPLTTVRPELMVFDHDGFYYALLQKVA